jgi:hypothetical protein
MFVAGRFLRNAKALLTYPFWILLGKSAPDNHIFKQKRVLSIATRFSCETFIETGTFYGQMTNVAKNQFKKVLSVELFEPLYKLNKKSFSGCPNIHIYLGDSTSELKNMLQEAGGRILFWLDGHYSGAGTACGDQISPILTELDIIGTHLRKDHCILIDDARLFSGKEGYPTIEATKIKLLKINPTYVISLDHDCIVALPER